MQIKNIKDVEAATAEIGELQSKRTRIELDAKKAVKEIEAAVPEAVAPIDSEIERLTNLIKDFVVDNRPSLFEKGSKTLKLATGEIFIRKDPDSIEGSITQNQIDEVLARYKLKGRVGALEDDLHRCFLRLKISADREQMLKSPKRATTRVGVKINKGGEKLHVEPHTVNAPPSA